MRTLSGFILATVAATGLLAQNRSGFVTPRSVTRVIPNVVFPGGTSAMRGVQRTTGNILYPGGGGPQIGVPGIPTARSNNVRSFGRRDAGIGYPIFVGGYEGYYQEPLLPPMPPPAPESNVIVVYPQAAPPVVINQYGYGDSKQSVATDRPGTRIFDLPGRQAAVEEPRSETADQFLIAFQDRSIYSAIAYWVDGDTLHYFTAGNTHNQASVSLVDRELTARLNKESGREVKLPPLK